MDKVKQHYDQHLAPVYSWMAGDLNQKVNDFHFFLEQQQIYPQQSKVALDLGAGHGIQSIALARAGFRVFAIDFNATLLRELQTNAQSLPIVVHEKDIRQIQEYNDHQAEVICCGGDTLSHLTDWAEITTFFEGVFKALGKGGNFILSFRDYTIPLEKEKRFISVKSDSDRIFTCFLEYEEERIWVTDLLHERKGDQWVQKVSTYPKVRLSVERVLELLIGQGFKIQFSGEKERMHYVVASR